MSFCICKRTVSRPGGKLCGQLELNYPNQFCKKKWSNWQLKALFFETYTSDENNFKSKYVCMSLLCGFDSYLNVSLVWMVSDFMGNRISKGGFFSESVIRFFRSPNLKKEIFQKTILNLKFKFPAKNTLLLLAGNLNFKLRIVFWNIFFWRFGDLKNESHFLKKSHL